MKKLTLIFICLFCCFDIFSQKITTIRMDPNYARGGSASEIFNKIEFIPLQSGGESTFDRIDQIGFSDDNIVILDRTYYNILIFKKNGTFHAKIKGRDSIKLITSFTIDDQRKEIIFRGDNAGTLYFYNFDGKRLRTQKMSSDQVASLYYFGDKLMLANIERPNKFAKNKDTTLYDLHYVRDFNFKVPVQKLLPYNPKFAPFEFNGGIPIYASDDNTCFFAMPYDYNIYHLGAKGIINQYKFLFPAENSLPVNFATDSAYTKKRVQYALDPKNNKKFIKIDNIFKVADNLTFITKYEGIFTADRFYSYNLKSGNLLSFGRVNGDKTSYLMELVHPERNSQIIGVHQGDLYASVPAMMLLSYADNKELKKMQISPELEEFFQKGSRLDNPVLIRLRLKEGL